MNVRSNRRASATRATYLGLVFCILNVFCHEAGGKSLYIAGGSLDPWTKLLWVYDVQPDGSLVYQTKTSFRGHNNLNFVNGLGMDPKNHVLFVTYTSHGDAGLIDRETLGWLGFTYMVPVDMFPGGLVYDEAAERLYTTDVDTKRLIIYNWDYQRKVLLNIGYGASSVPLEAENSGAITLNKAKNLVYVASKTKDVQVLKTAFNRGDWTQQGRIPLDFAAKSLGVDSTRQLLYAGGLVNRNAVITRYNLKTNTAVTKIVGSRQGTVLSISVDDSTSLVYTLIGETYDSMNDARVLKVFDSDLDTFFSIPFHALARRLYIPSSPVGYNPLHLTMTPLSGIVSVNGQYMTSPGSVVEYQVCITNTNLLPVTEVTLTDALPDELDFVKAIPSGNATGVYDQQTRTYQYLLPKLDSKATHCMRLFAQVKEDTAPGAVVSNTVVLNSNETPSASATVDVKVEHNPMGLTKSVVPDPNHVQVGSTYYVDPGSLLTYQVCMSNLANEYAVADVLLTDQLPPEVDFISAEEGGVSFYNPTDHTYSWAFDEVDPNYMACFNIVVRVKDDVAPGQVITNRAILEGSETASVSTEVTVVTKFKALALTKTIKQGPDYDPVKNQVRRGGLITYVIHVKNTEAVHAVQELILRDAIPQGLEYESADFGGAVGAYDPTSHAITVTRPNLGPGQAFTVEMTFLVSTDLLPGTELTNTVIAMANGAPASSTSVSTTVFYLDMLQLSTPKIYYTAPLLRQDRKDELMFDMKFPSHIDQDDIDTTEPLTLTPGHAKSYFRPLASGLRTTYKVYGRDGQIRIEALFDRQPVLNTLASTQAKVSLSVTGRLVDGQQFVGTVTVPVR